MKESFDIVIIGGGAIGTSTLYQLSKSGANVALLEEFEIGRAHV